MLNFKSLHRDLKEFDSSFVFPDMQTVEEYVRLRYERGDSINAIIQDLGSFNFKFEIKGIDWAAVVLQILRKNISCLMGEFHQVYLYQEEIDRLQEIENEKARKFLYLALIVHKWNRHPSGWVHYERDDFFKFWGMQDLKKAEKEAIAQEAVKHGLELRVIGNKNPIICYHIKFLKEVGEVVAIYDGEHQIKEWWNWLGL